MSIPSNGFPWTRELSLWHRLPRVMAIDARMKRALRLVIVAQLIGLTLILPPPKVLSFRRPVDPAPPPDCARVLFLGNSLTFTHDIPANTQRLASLLTGARSLCVTAHAEPGVTLEWHWNDPETSRLLAERWDYVVLQEQSERAYDQPAQMDAWLTAFAQKIRHAGAEPLLFAIFSRQWPEERRVELHDRMRASARSLGLRVVPVDDVWTDILRDDPSAPILAADGHHPAPYGAYSAALLFARCMVGPLNEPAAYTFDEPPRFLYRALLGEHPQIAQREGNAAYRAVARRAVTCIAPNR